jgi:hypothetical protein
MPGFLLKSRLSDMTLLFISVSYNYLFICHLSLFCSFALWQALYVCPTELCVRLKLPYHTLPIPGNPQKRVSSCFVLVFPACSSPSFSLRSAVCVFLVGYSACFGCCPLRGADLLSFYFSCVVGARRMVGWVERWRKGGSFCFWTWPNTVGTGLLAYMDTDTDTDIRELSDGKMERDGAGQGRG